ncbi:MAG TPA: ribulose-phosphate 3-epimerase [Planctomycetota bacterium]|nr:ribulose-phosphate 3-epimerase [Planctomycetota bacterium]
MPEIKVSASILSADFSCLQKALERCQSSGVDSLHMDIMDGHFVPNISFGPVVIKALRPLTKLPMDAHLMIENPGWYIEEFAKAGADIITVHAECFGKLKAHCAGLGQFPKEIESLDEARLLSVIRQIKKAGPPDRAIRAGLAFNPGSPMCATDKILKELDEVTIMSVNPGFSGQGFMPEALPKIKELRSRYKGDIRVDGGINDKTAPDAIKAGANILVTASYFFGSKDPKKAVETLRLATKAQRH